MINLVPVARVVGFAALTTFAAAAVAPAFAGPAELQLLRSYEGSWRGKGTLVGGDSQPVNCRMSLQDGNEQKINYSGRCTLAGANLSISGTLAYVEASHRYEGVMTSNANFSGVAVGQKKGDGIVFSMKSRGVQENANLEISAGIVLTPGVITVQFQATDAKSGKTVHATVPFAKVLSRPLRRPSARYEARAPTGALFSDRRPGSAEQARLPHATVGKSGNRPNEVTRAAAMTASPSLPPQCRAPKSGTFRPAAHSRSPPRS